MPLHLRAEKHLASSGCDTWLLSTVFVTNTIPRAADPLMRIRNDFCEYRELPFASDPCLASRGALLRMQAVDDAGERKESGPEVFETAGEPNRKESQERSSAALLKTANTSRMDLFEEPKRQCSAWAGEKVMDRDAERVAGGNDAI